MNSLPIAEFLDKDERKAAARDCIDLLIDFNYSMAQIAESMETDRAAVSRWRSGQHCPSAENLSGLINRLISVFDAKMVTTTDTIIKGMNHNLEAKEDGIVVGNSAAIQSLRRYLVLQMEPHVAKMHEEFLKLIKEDLKRLG